MEGNRNAALFCYKERNFGGSKGSSYGWDLHSVVSKNSNMVVIQIDAKTEPWLRKIWKCKIQSRCVSSN